MNAAVAGLIGAAIGTLASLFGNLISSFAQAKQDEKRWHRSLKMQGYQNLQIAIADLTRKTSLIVHEIMFLAGTAKTDPQKVSPERIDAYDQTMYKLLPKFWSNLNYVSALDFDTYTQLLPLAQSITRLEDEVDEVIVLYNDINSRDESLELISNCFSDAVNLYDKIPETFANILSFHRIGKGIGTKQKIVNMPQNIMKKHPKD